MKKISQLLLVFLMVFGLCTQNSYAYSRDENTNVVKNVAKLISSYALRFPGNHKDVLDELKEISLDDYEIWADVMNYWDYIENDMIENVDDVPDGIPEDNHVFIVLGYALKDDGTMEDELIGRLQVALSSANKYPNSYILVTGGVEQNGWTEGARMRDWLVDNGVSEDRIIVEIEAEDTAGNAANSFEMLYTDYKDIQSCSLITSQYHLKRGSILYYAESLLKAKELGVEAIEFIGDKNAGYKVEDKDSESMIIKAFSLCGIAHCTDVVIMTIAASLIPIIFIVILLIVVYKRRKKYRMLHG